MLTVPVPKTPRISRRWASSLNVCIAAIAAGVLAFASAAVAQSGWTVVNLPATTTKCRSLRHISPDRQ